MVPTVVAAGLLVSASFGFVAPDMGVRHRLQPVEAEMLRVKVPWWRAAPKFKDHYEVLGLRSNATAAEIKRAYRRKAAVCHPDVDGSVGAASSFAAVLDAYACLRDPEARSAFDARRRAHRLATVADGFVDDVLVPWVKESAVPFARDVAAPILGKGVEIAVQAANTTTAVAAAAGFVVAGPIGAVSAVAAERAVSSVVDDKVRPAAAAAAGFVVAGPVGAVSAVAAERAVSSVVKDKTHQVLPENNLTDPIILTAADFRSDAGFELRDVSPSSSTSNFRSLAGFASSRTSSPPRGRPLDQENAPTTVPAGARAFASPDKDNNLTTSTVYDLYDPPL
ncbi:hypothetical protein CTAYLR_006618 [Chrysophaeum taylorii]|uniref:J domain-containing protein n=1 Tax=Chrysophaeum taylorii TaxID=2483200 RepID=A0AAD7ULA4_9STRA|nr:hypothetical protein CTAYLR_006618 [Chrysophaeum taylorii]